MLLNTACGIEQMGRCRCSGVTARARFCMRRGAPCRPLAVTIVYLPPSGRAQLRPEEAAALTPSCGGRSCSRRNHFVAVAARNRSCCVRGNTTRKFAYVKPRHGN
ncbi:hypothetical protein HPB50_009767 [Hyalomma asiaticum]|uniref:Uncharacterized protein n=1 Tax=Hyalomma asiaticum TaxID=266040 RepID=A0ACB7RZI8_HYAAI|nr:hypothetical protein HPB50_009767 [Hyalomma asiaticum]